MLFFYNPTAPTEIYTLSLHDALPISERTAPRDRCGRGPADGRPDRRQDEWSPEGERDRKSTRLNSSHTVISYAVFCLKKKTTPGQAPRSVHQRPRHHSSRVARVRRRH